MEQQADVANESRRRARTASTAATAPGSTQRSRSRSRSRSRDRSSFHHHRAAASSAAARPAVFSAAATAASPPAVAAPAASGDGAAAPAPAAAPQAGSLAAAAAAAPAAGADVPAAAAAAHPPACLRAFVYPADRVHNLLAPERESALSTVRYLLITVNNNEHHAMWNYMAPVPHRGRESFLEATVAQGVHVVIGQCGVHRVALVQSAVGDSTVGSISNVIHALRPHLPHLCAVINVGVAYGGWREKQHLGDVLVSSTMIDCATVRENNDGSKEYRGVNAEASLRLTSRARHVVSEMLSKFTSHMGPILSGPALIDSKRVKTALQVQFPSAIGGEMEGIGLYTAVTLHKLEWLIVKGICDWADGEKEKHWQPCAAERAAMFVQCMLSKQDQVDEVHASAEQGRPIALPRAGHESARAQGAAGAASSSQVNNSVGSNSGTVYQAGQMNITHRHAAVRAPARASPADVAAQRRRQPPVSAAERAANYASGDMSFEPSRAPLDFQYSVEDMQDPRVASIGHRFGEHGYGQPVFFAPGTIDAQRSAEMKILVPGYFKTNTDGDHFCYRSDLYEKFTEKQRQSLLKYNIPSTGNIKCAQLRRDAGF